MNIDLLVTKKGEAGLLCSRNLISKAQAVVLDSGNGILSIEFAQMDSMDMNIPIEEEYFDLFDNTPFLHIGSVKDGKIGQAYQVPLMILNDPYRMHLLQSSRPPEKPLLAFQYFVKDCTLGQPIHRDDMGDETTNGCILGDTLPSSLEFAPQLAKRHGFEIQNIPVPDILPSLGPGGGATTRRSTWNSGGVASGNTGTGSGKNTNGKDEDSDPYK